MIPRRIQNATHRLGPPADWDETKHGKCTHLDVRQSSDAQGNTVVQSAWEPTPDELSALINGGSLILTIWGGQPPVSLHTETLEQGAKVTT